MKKGFTLIELLIVIAIIAIIAGAVLVAINPAKRIGQANDSQRWSEVNSILNAIQQSIVDNAGTTPACDGTDPDTLLSALEPLEAFEICDGCVGNGTTATGDDTDTDTIIECNLTPDLVTTGNYLASMPGDPVPVAGDAGVGYTVTRLATGAFCIEAPGKYGTDDIKVCR